MTASTAPWRIHSNSKHMCYNLSCFLVCLWEGSRSVSMLDGIQAGGKQELLMRHELTCCICIAFAACIYTQAERSNDPQNGMRILEIP